MVKLNTNTLSENKMNTLSQIVKNNAAIKSQNANNAAIKDDTNVIDQMQAITNEINRLRQINSNDPKIAALSAMRTEIGRSNAIWQD